MTEMVISIGVGWAILAVFMAALWCVHLALRNAAVVDAGWAAGLPILAVLFAWRSPAGGAAPWLLAAMVTLWGGRLAGFLLIARVVGHPEEGRYQELRRRWRTHLGAKFFVFFQAQALLDLVLSLPFLLIDRAGGPISSLQWTAAALWAVAFVGELTADAQLDRFKSDASNRGRLCDVGLWRYSRHPNYFFEWLIWVAYALFALNAPWGALGVLSPLLILLFLFRVTGIPETEAQALRSRGEAYRRYQQTTSVFVPWFPKAPRP